VLLFFCQHQRGGRPVELARTSGSHNRRIPLPGTFGRNARTHASPWLVTLEPPPPVLQSGPVRITFKVGDESPLDTDIISPDIFFCTMAEKTVRQCGLELHAKCGRARSTTLHLPHGPVETPVFMPVGTQGARRCDNRK
jgi:hypothetical protein